MDICLCFVSGSRPACVFAYRHVRLPVDSVRALGKGGRWFRHGLVPLGSFPLAQSSR